MKLGFSESKYIAENNIVFPRRLELDLQDFAQTYNGIDYTDIFKLQKNWNNISNDNRKEIKKLVSIIKRACNETGLDAYELAREYPEDKTNCDKLVKAIKATGLKEKKSSIRLKINENDNVKNVTYRIDYYGSWDNGHVLHSYKKDTIENAEQEAKSASIKDKDNLYYVSIDNVMNPRTDYTWYQGKPYHYMRDEDELQRIRKEINIRRSANN